MNRLKIILALGLLVVLMAGFFIIRSASSSDGNKLYQNTIAAQEKTAISASGSVVSQQETALHFQTFGKLTSLPFKVGDLVSQGETIASLDSTQALHNETSAEAQYRSAQAALNLVLDNIHLSQYGNGGFSNVGSSNETQTQTTERQEAEEAVNAAYDNLQNAKQALTLYSLSAPFDGVLTAEDVNVAGINVTPTTTFTLADPTKAVFEALVSPDDTGLISPGSSVSLNLDNLKNHHLSGQVIKIDPDKTTDSSGESVYKVDILVPNLLSYAKFGLTGTALIQPSISGSITQVPSWTIVGNQFVWIMNGQSAILKKVTVGESRDGLTEILGGLSITDKVITDPKFIIFKEYRLL